MHAYQKLPTWRKYLTMIIFFLITLKQCKFSWIVSHLKFLQESNNHLQRENKSFIKDTTTQSQMSKCACTCTEIPLRAAVCKYWELAVKTEIQNSSYSVRNNPLVKRFRKSQSKFPNSFLFRENRQKVKCCPTPYSRRSKTFELYHFQSPREERRFKETSSSLAGK